MGAATLRLVCVLVMVAIMEMPVNTRNVPPSVRSMEFATIKLECALVHRTGQAPIAWNLSILAQIIAVAPMDTVITPLVNVCAIPRGFSLIAILRNAL